MENVLEDRAAVEVLEVLDFHATCDVAGCGGVAARVARLGCCGTEYLICDAHRDQIVAAYERPAHKYEERHVDRGVACFEVVPWVTFRPVGGPA